MKVRLSGEQVRRLNALRVRYPELRGINQALNAAIELATRGVYDEDARAAENEYRQAQWDKHVQAAQGRPMRRRKSGRRPRQRERPTQVERAPAPTLPGRGPAVPQQTHAAAPTTSGEYEPRLRVRRAAEPTTPVHRAAAPTIPEGDRPTPPEGSKPVGDRGGDGR